jgi:tetratricopeptide (TPR) repeat protein
VSPRTRVWLAVAAIAAAAAVAVVGATVLVSRGQTTTPPAPAVRPGAPPLVLELGLREDREAAELRRAERLYDRGRRAAAGRLFARSESLNAQVGAALAAWPNASLSRLEALAGDHPRSALVRLHLGLARFWLGDRAGAEADWRAAKRLDPDTPSAIRADDLLHPNLAHGLPVFVPSFPPPPGLVRLSPARALARLAADARGGDARARVLYGVALQRVGRPVSAERQYELAAARAPHDAEAQVAAAVGRFDKDDPAAAFGRLGPLTRTFPRAPTVRFHLGLLLLWTGRVDAAKVELRRARAEAPSSPLGREANRFLARLAAIRTS